MHYENRGITIYEYMIYEFGGKSTHRVLRVDGWIRDTQNEGFLIVISAVSQLKEQTIISELSPQ